MESTGSLEKRRGRSKKIAEALRNGGLLAEPTSSPSSSVGEGLDLFPDSPLPPASGFQLSSDFRYDRALIFLFEKINYLETRTIDSVSALRQAQRCDGARAAVFLYVSRRVAADQN